MTKDIDLLRQAVQADIDIAINRLLSQKIAPLNILICGLLLTVESDETLRKDAIKWTGELLDEARSANGIDADGVVYVEQAIDMLSRRTVAKASLQMMREHVGQAK